MAQLQLQPPEPFNFRHPDDWPRWKRRFEQFRIASGLAEGSSERQVSTLLYCLGEQAEAVLTSTNATPDERKEYATVLAKFDGFFKVRKNVIFERARFNRRNQREGESAEDYIVALYDLADNCDYGELQSEMIRDRLVVGIRDTALSERLQLDADLTLEKAKKAVRQREAVQDQQRELDGADPRKLESLHTNRGNRRRQRGRSSGYTGKPKNNSSTPGSCTRCGKDAHPRDKCPAKDAECHKCKKKGHYGAVCRTKKIAAVEETDLPCVDAFLDNLTPDGKEVAWLTRIQLNNKLTLFKLDTGAQVTAINTETHQRLGQPTLHTPDKQLYGPAGQPLKVVGQFNGTFTHNHRKSSQPVYVVDNLKTNLLGLPTIMALNLAARIAATTKEERSDILKQFPKVFQGLGTLGDEFTIKLKPGATPHALYTPRRVPLPLLPQVEAELKRMESMGVISRVDEPTPWCAGMVVVPKRNGKVRICVDLKPLNECVLREVHPLPRVDETLARLTGATVFSKLDANSGFWQVPLTKSSRLLTTFITPSGRYHFNKLPFGISSAPELFQKRMSAILCDLEGVVCQMDDILVFGKDQAEHDGRLTAVLKRIESSGVTLNPEKCEFSRRKLSFLGHIINEAGVQADPDKTSAIREMKPPTNIPELRRFMGMVNQLGKFSSHLAEITQPLRELLSKKSSWLWGPNQAQAFRQVKDELSKPTTLVLYDPTAESKVSADASSYGLGAVLLQNCNSEWRPVAFASRSMSETERRYAQIEKEALAITWACDKFSMYILGKHFQIETDHKPLIPLLGSKQLDNLPPRILRFRLRLARFNYSISHVPGKHMYTADTLSRAPTSEQSDPAVEELAELAMEACIAYLPASPHTLQQYREAQNSDPLCSLAMKYCRIGWPGRTKVDDALQPYWDIQGELTLQDNLLLRGTRIVVPTSMQEETLEKLHAGHQGIERCRQRARISVWWPGVSSQIEKMVSKCPQCVKERPPRKEPLISTLLPDYPWQKIASDLFTLEGKTYLLVCDYFSRYPEVIQLTSTTSGSIITSLKSIFSRYGIPEELVSDNGPQYASQEFSEFAKQYNFKHTTSSPHFPQSNGHAERSVQTVKRLLKGSKDPYMSLLSYRSTPLPWCHLSPAQLLMGRHIRSNIPMTVESLVPKWDYLDSFLVANSKIKQKQKADYDSRHDTRLLPEIPDNTNVWVRTDNQHTEGRISGAAGTPRSYLVSTPSGEIRRNRAHLTIRTDLPTAESSHPPKRSPIQTRARTGTPIVPPERL